MDDGRPGQGVTVVRITHSAMVAEYRERERLLQREHGYRMHLVNPAAGDNGGKRIEMEPDAEVASSVLPTRGRPGHPILFWFPRRHLRRVLLEQRPDIVDLHEEPYSLCVAAALPVIRSAAPQARICLYTAQNLLKRYPTPFRQLERRALRSCQAAYPCSTEAGDVLRAKGFSGSVRVIPLGVTLEPPRAVAEEVTSIGYVGRLEDYKGVQVALEAFAASSVSGSATLEFLGDGPQREPLAARARELGVAERTRLPGPVSQEEALRRIRSYDVLLVPSLTTERWKEQFGRVAAQGLAAGTAVVASDSGSLREVVGDAGELVTEGDPDAFRTAIDRLAEDPARRAELAEAGRRRAAERFAWDRIAADVHEMYAELLTTPI